MKKLFFFIYQLVRASLTIWGVLFLSGFLMQLFPQEKRVGTLTGTVIDSETKQALTGVNVMVENTYFGSATDSKGRFIIKEIPAGNYSVKFSAIGYEQIRVEVTIFLSKETNIIVEMKPLASKAISITGTETTKQQITTPTQIRYERKSISYANIVFISNPNVKVEDKQAKYLIKKFREYIEMPRFDYNPIPDELFNEFQAEIKSRGTKITLDEVVEILKQKFVPKIIEILDIEKEMRAQNLLTEAQRNSFIATKAKTLGITAEQLMKVMNSAFIYIPVISDYKLETNEESGLLSVTINAGAIWYRVVYDESGAGNLKLVVKKETKGTGIAKIGKTFNYDGENVNDKEFAFRTAVVALARDLQVATREIPEFQLGAQVVEVYPNYVAFPMGTKEGIKIDDGFDLIEAQENPQGGIRYTKVGFVRITYVANNRTNPRALSRAQVIIGKGLEPGIYVSERPRLPIDLTVRVLNNPFVVEGDEKITITGYSIGAELLYNLGRDVNMPQFWIGGGGFIGTASKGLKIYDVELLYGVELPNVSIAGLYGALMKKFYFKRLCALGRIDLIFEDITFSSEDESNKLSHSSFGIGFDVGGEYVATPDLNFGFNFGYRFFSKSAEWEGAFTLSNSANHSGFVFSIYANYSLQRLRFDPIAWIRGALGW